jgi:hypothetical protein
LVLPAARIFALGTKIAFAEEKLPFILHHLVIFSNLLFELTVTHFTTDLNLLLLTLMLALN